MRDPRYPVGEFAYDPLVTGEKRRQWIDEIRRAPAALRGAVEGLTEEQLETPYRAGGWTVRQVVHHLPDSHLNAYTRLRLALTEENPTIRPYDEARWAELPDARHAPVALSLELLELLHRRWVLLLESLRPADFARTLVHPEQGVLTLDRVLQSYAWHGRHHVAQVTALRERMGWDAAAAHSPAGARLREEIRHAVVVRARPEAAYDALATAAGLDGWFTRGASVDARPGGSIRFRWIDWGPEGVSGEDGGPVLEAERPRRLVFQWHPDGPAYATTVEVDFEPVAEGTVVRVREHGYRETPGGRRAMLDCAAGWGEALALLKFHLEHGWRG